MHKETRSRKSLTIEALYDPDRKGDFEGKPKNEWAWSDSGQYRRRATDKDAADKVWWSASPASSEAEPTFDIDRMRGTVDALADNESSSGTLSVHAINEDGTRALVAAGSLLALYDIAGNSAIRMSSAMDTDVTALFSPDGRWASFIAGNNLHIADATDGGVKPLTREGSNTVLAGRLDWVYQEEIYGRGEYRGYWWSPDATRIAYLQLEVSQVSQHTIQRYESGREETETYRYPRAGTANPVAKIGIVNIGNGDTRWVDVPEGANDELIVNVAWDPTGHTLAVQTQDREQTSLDLWFVDAATGESRSVLRETSKAWTRMTGPPHWFDDGSFVWLSDRTGWSHLYHYSRDGQLVGPISSGEWDVRETYGVYGNSVFFAATERSSISLHTYRIQVDGNGMERLTTSEGTHRSTFSTDMQHFIDAWSSVDRPAQVRLHTSDGNEIDELEECSAPDASQYELGATEYLQVAARDGTPLEAMMIKPPDFDPNRQYPVLCHVYGGPMTPLVRNAWGGTSYLWHHLIAARGAIVWTVDPRTASSKGVESAYPVYGNFGRSELEDLEDGLRWLKGQRYVDADRIGIWGWSFGGYLTVYAMTHSESFRMGIAGAPVTDWALYDSIYTERYMRTPEHNPDGYRDSSVLESASNLHGKLLIVHGTMDDNVHLDHSMRLVGELQKAHKDFESMFYPGARHGIEDPQQLYDLRRRMTGFILENL